MRLGCAVHIWAAAWFQMACLKEAPSPASTLWPERKSIRHVSLSTVHWPYFSTGAIVDLMAASPPATGVCWRPHWGLLWTDWGRLLLLLLQICIWWMIIKHICHLVTLVTDSWICHILGPFPQKEKKILAAVWTLMVCVVYWHNNSSWLFCSFCILINSDLVNNIERAYEDSNCLQ